MFSYINCSVHPMRVIIFQQHFCAVHFIYNLAI
nr:MAG TPA: hypothetical protein [Bacteriophage sp.]